jgi:hypothetical protein
LLILGSRSLLDQLQLPVDRALQLLQAAGDQFRSGLRFGIFVQRLDEGLVLAIPRAGVRRQPDQSLQIAASRPSLMSSRPWRVW